MTRKLNYGEYGIFITKISLLYGNIFLNCQRWRVICMKEKIKNIIKRNLKVIGKIGLVSTSLLFYTSTCFAGVSDSKLATGTTNLINDLTNWLLVLAPVLTVLLVGYYLLRKSASDEMDSKRWDTRIKVALICCIGVVVASGLITVIIGYYK